MEFDIAIETLDVLKITDKDILHCFVLFFLECSVILPGKRIFFTKKIILMDFSFFMKGDSFFYAACIFRKNHLK